jgi:hypothetical protein
VDTKAPAKGSKKPGKGGKNTTLPVTTSAPPPPPWPSDSLLETQSQTYQTILCERGGDAGEVHPIAPSSIEAGAAICRVCISTGENASAL